MTLALSTIHHENLTNFHRNHFIITVTDLKDTEQLKTSLLNDENYISIETCRRLFPNASKESIAGLLLTTLQMKISQQKTDFLFVFNDEDKCEAMDILNGLVHVLGLTPKQEQQEKYFEMIKAYGVDWTHILIEQEQRLKKIHTNKYLN